MDEKEKQRLARMCGLITTLAEVEWMPKSMFYISIGMDLRESDIVIGIAEKAGYVESTSTMLKITEEGRIFAADIEAEIAKNPEATR